MPATTAPASAAAVSADALWREIIDAAHEGCVLRCSNRLREAQQVMEHTLPALIRAWSQAAGLTGPARREKLRRLFSEVQERVATAVISQRLVAVRAPEYTAGGYSPGRPLQLNQRIPFGDVPTMLDGLSDHECRWRTAPRPFSAAARRPSSASVAIPC